MGRHRVHLWYVVGALWRVRRFVVGVDGRFQWVVGGSTAVGVVGFGARPGRIHAASLVGHLRIHRRPRRVGDAPGEVGLIPGDERLRSTGARRRWSAHGSPRSPSRPARSRSSGRSGWIAGSSSQRTASTPGRLARARTHHAPNTVLCGAFWLKSMNTRAPRSSFHHCPVISSGRRSSIARATATAACRVPKESQPWLDPRRRRAARGCRWS